MDLPASRPPDEPMNRRSLPIVGLLALQLVATGACDAKK